MPVQVSFFGHKDADSSATVVSLEVRSEKDDAAVRTLRLTGRHYLPIVMDDKSSLHHKYARDVSVGDKLMLVDGPGSQSTVGVVVGKEVEQAKGLFNPYTKVCGAPPFGAGELSLIKLLCPLFCGGGSQWSGACSGAAARQMDVQHHLVEMLQENLAASEVRH